MAYFSIIQLSAVPIGRNSRIKGIDITEDPLFLERSDWGGDPVQDREKELYFLKRSLAPVAVLDEKKGTVTFESRAVVRRQYCRHLVNATRDYVANLIEGYGTYHDFHKDVENACDISDLFHIGYCMTASKVIDEYLSGWLPQVMHIGQLLYAHC